MLIEVPLWVAILYVVLLLLALGLGIAQAAQLDHLRIRTRWQTEFIDNLLDNPDIDYKPANPAFYDFNTMEEK